MNTNRYEAAARADKVDALVCYLDTMAQRRGVDLNTAEAADKMAAALRNMTVRDWAAYSLAAGVRPASATTWADLVRVYETRAAMLAEPGAVPVAATETGVAS